MKLALFLHPSFIKLFSIFTHIQSPAKLLFTIMFEAFHIGTEKTIIGRMPAKKGYPYKTLYWEVKDLIGKLLLLKHHRNRLKNTINYCMSMFLCMSEWTDTVG